jgi:hypothetical protein
MIRKLQFIGMALVRWRIKSPTQLVSGPGKTGIKLPIMPSAMNKNEITIKNISMIKMRL